MAFTFTDITNEIQDTLARTDTVVTAKISSWANRRQRMAASRYNFAFMRLQASPISVTVAGGQQYSLPSDFKDEQLFYLQKTDSFKILAVASTANMRMKFSPADTGEPEAVTLQPGSGSFLIWPPTVDQTYTVQLDYFQYPPDLSGTQTNWLSDNAPYLYIAGGVADGLHFVGADDEAIRYWEQRYEDAYQNAKKIDVSRQLPDQAILAPRFDVGRPGPTQRQLAGWPW